ncbi:MAG TPA: CHAT domain-containing protein [Coleofasciculaceae cyanobacterium]|jgi:DNA integrity scanning protein DisA with diadenylate cyclase activity
MTKNIPEDTLDLQIFLTRSPGHKPSKYEGIPSFTMSNESWRHYTYRDAQYASKEEHQLQSELGYIAIANSNVVEEVTLPFSLGEVSEMMQKLNFNRVKLMDCMEFGERLFNFAIHGSIRDLFRSLSDQSKILRVTIATVVPELAVLPWELMCDTKSGSFPQFLCYQPNIRLCRSLHLFNRKDFISKSLGESNSKLKILLVTADPLVDNPLDCDTEERMFRFVLDEAPSLRDVELRVLHNANINSLRDALNKFKPHILHLSCHGGYDKDENLGFIVLTSPREANKPDFVNSYRLASVVQEADSVQFAFISTCYGAFGSQVSAFSGVAQLLHASGIDDVVALHFMLLDKTGHAILLNFYKYLLRSEFTVEESVSRVRRFLFINGYSATESFGFALYQSNTSLYSSSREEILRESITDSQEFERTVESFENDAVVKEKLNITLSELLKDQLEAAESLKNLKLPSEEVGLAIQAFGLERASEIINEIKDAKVQISLFLKIAEISKVLALSSHESKAFSTAFILKEDTESGEELESTSTEVSKLLDPNFFLSEFKSVIEEAIKVNGEDRVFVISFNKNKKQNYKSFIQNIKLINDEDLKELDVLGDSKWLKISYLVRKSGCAFVLPGDRRVKLFANTEQVAEFNSGRWLLSHFRELRRHVLQIAHNLEIDEKIVIDVLKKSVYSSEVKQGLTILIQGENNLLERCTRCTKVQDSEKFIELKEKTIAEFDRNEYIQLVSGDGAIILSKTGYTIAIQAFLKLDSEEKNSATGARHSAACVTTKHCDAIAIVVSVDGPISVFHHGNKVFSIG